MSMLPFWRRCWSGELAKQRATGPANEDVHKSRLSIDYSLYFDAVVRFAVEIAVEKEVQNVYIFRAIYISWHRQSKGIKNI